MTDRLTDEVLAELANLAAATTPAPWRAELTLFGYALRGANNHTIMIDDPSTAGIDARDHAFSAAARNTFPSLLAEVREARAFKASLLEAFRDAAFFHRRAESDDHVRWESEEDARSEAEAEIEEMGDSGWPEDAGNVSHGVLIYLSSAVETNHRPAPDGSEFETFCDVVLKDEPYAGAILRLLDEAKGGAT